MVAVGAALLGTRVVGSAWLVQFDQSAQRTAAARWAANVIGSVDWVLGATTTAPARTNAPSTADGQRRYLPRLRGACSGIVGVRRPRIDEVGAGSGVVCLPTMGSPAAQFTAHQGTTGTPLPRKRKGSGHVRVRGVVKQALTASSRDRAQTAHPSHGCGGDGAGSDLGRGGGPARGRAGQARGQRGGLAPPVVGVGPRLHRLRGRKGGPGRCPGRPGRGPG